MKNRSIFLYILVGIFQNVMPQDRTFLLSRQSFATDLYKNFSRPESYLISPASIDFALSALFFGSSQQTFLELMDGLHYPKNYSINFIQNNFMLLYRKLKQVNGLEMATKIYISETLTLQQSYKTTIVRVLNADIEQIAFSESVEAAEKINSWVAEKTHNMITEVIDADTINSGTTMILVNCIYFKGSWLYTFPKNKTFTGDFYVDEANTVPVDYMTIKSQFKFGYFEELGGSIAVSLPYKNSDMTMLLVLPINKTGLPDLISRMSDFDWSTIDQKMRKTDVNVTMPKFNVSFDAHIETNLKNMGIRDIFDAKLSNLDRILSSAVKHDNLYVDTIIHKAIINVDEEGTVAAAVTVIMSRSIEMQFRADHPFLFMLRTGSSILFVGQFTGDRSPTFNDPDDWKTTLFPIGNMKKSQKKD